MSCLAPNCLLVVPIVAALLYAAYTDLRVHKIWNPLTGLVAVLALVYVGMCAPVSMWHWHLLSAFSIFAIGIFLFKFGAFGGGDVKLWAASALLFPPSLLMQQVLAVTIAGFVLAILLMGTRFVVRIAAPADGPSDAKEVIPTRNRAVLPYGVAIAAGTIFILLKESPGGAGCLASLGIPF